MRVSNNRPRHTRVRLAAIFFAVATTSLAGVAQTPGLRLVSTAWPPFTNPPGQARFALDLVEAALTRVNVSSTTSIVEADAFTQALVSGPYDGSAAAWRDGARERALIFSQPYLENRLVLVARSGGDVTARQLTDLKGKRIAIVGGYSYGDTVELTGPTFVRSKTEEDSLRMLLASEVDYTLMDEVVVEYILTHHEAEAKARLQLGRTALLTRPLYLAIRRSRPDAQSIVDRFNAQLRGMIADRTYHRLLHVDWINADVDGDGRTEYVPSTDQVGKLPPLRAYTLITPEAQPQRRVEIAPGYYIGGKFYNAWTDVPDEFKAGSGRPSADRSTASVFTFVWK
jgi:polar amino acid transport system substrate-binding protein